MQFKIKVIDFEITEPFAYTKSFEGYAKVQTLIRLYTKPLGYITMPVVDGMLDTEQLIEKIFSLYGRNILETLVYFKLCSPIYTSDFSLQNLFNAKQSSSLRKQPIVTVVVCTRNRTKDLELCLRALTELTYKNLDVIVVDNAPDTTDTETLVKSKFKQFQYVCESRPGLDWARNRGIIEAKGEIIAYTDDDVIVDKYWINKLSKLFEENEEVTAITGLVVPYELETPAQVLFEKRGGFGRGFKRKWVRIYNGKVPWYYLGTGQFGTGANMAFRKKVFTEIGLFDPALDVGTVTNGGGDLEILFRILKHQNMLVYEPEAIVRHEHRKEYYKLKEQLKNNSKGLYSYCIRSMAVYPDQKTAFFRIMYWWLVNWNIKKLLKSIRRPSQFPRDLRWAEFKGCFTSFRLYSKAKKRVGEIINTYGPQINLPDDVPKGKLNVLYENADISTKSKVRINLDKPLQPIIGIETFYKVVIELFSADEIVAKLEIVNAFQNLSVSSIAEAIAQAHWFTLFSYFNKSFANSTFETLILKAKEHYSKTFLSNFHLNKH